MFIGYEGGVKMTLEELKGKIETNSLDNSGLIFCFNKDRFLVDQYVNAIAKLKNLIIEYSSEVPKNFIFGFIDDSRLTVVVKDTFEQQDVPDNCIVITKSKLDNAIVFPELEAWQIKDYVLSICKGGDESILETLIQKCDNLYGLQNEIDKLSIFEENMRSNLSKEFYENDVFTGINKINVFDFSNAVQNKSCSSVRDLYKNMEKDPIFITSILTKQFRNMVNVYLQSYPTEENTGLKDKQIWAIKNVCKKYTKQELLSKFKFLLSVDYSLKSGKIPAEILFDYILINLLV